MRQFFLFLMMTSFCFSAFTDELLQQVLSTQKVANKISDTKSVSLLLSGAISVATVNRFDDEIRSGWSNHKQMSKSLSSWGDFLGSGIPSLMIVGGQYLWDPQEQNWMSHARAVAWETAIVTIMKYSFGRKRPGGSQNHLSFPSGHTAVAFATATSLTYSYGWKVGVVAFPVATFVGFSRLADDAHWGSDVVGGAFVGFIVARACSFIETDESLTSRAQWLPYISPEQSSLTYVYSF